MLFKHVIKVTLLYFTIRRQHVDALVEPRRDVKCPMSLTGSQSHRLLQSLHLYTVAHQSLQ